MNPAAAVPPTARPLSAELVHDLATIAQIDAVPVILQVICQSTGMAFSAVARVTDERWVACAVRDEVGFGMVAGDELALRTTVCDEVRQTGSMVVIEDVSRDPHFCTHESPRQFGFQSFISVPIVRTNGSLFGTLCAFDGHPARLDTPQTIGMFRLFGELIALHLDALDRIAADLVMDDLRHTAELRDQFIAVLSHDLRTPLASIVAGTSLLEQRMPDANVRPVIALMQRSVGRMTDLVSNVLDFARGRLGGGLPVTRIVTDSLEKSLRQVIAEVKAVQPERIIDSTIAIERAVNCDPGRVAQLVSNLLGNAVTHGDPSAPIRLDARTTDTALIVSVTNGGPPIPREALGRLFAPFSRGAVRPGAKGLGLGLYIASEVAKAHGGSIAVHSDAEETRFVFEMPLAAAGTS